MSSDIKFHRPKCSLIAQGGLPIIPLHYQVLQESKVGHLNFILSRMSVEQVFLHVLQILLARHQANNIPHSFICKSRHISPTWSVHTNRFYLNPLLLLKDTSGEQASLSLLGNGVITRAVLEMMEKDLFKYICHNCKTDRTDCTLSLLCLCLFKMAKTVKLNTFSSKTFVFSWWDYLAWRGKKWQKGEENDELHILYPSANIRMLKSDWQEGKER